MRWCEYRYVDEEIAFASDVLCEPGLKSKVL